jgi:phage FluMu protein Com
MNCNKFNLRDYCINYKPGQKIFKHVLEKRYGTRANDAFHHLSVRGYFYTAHVLRCPNCNTILFQADNTKMFERKSVTCKHCGQTIKREDMIIEPVLIRTGKEVYKKEMEPINVELYDEQGNLNKDYAYVYGKRAKELNDIQTEMFKEMKKETDKRVYIYATLPNGERIVLDSPITFEAITVKELL